ncbi:hypothetical protein HDU98_003894 [Podochytrium sp. JEL0797]|nr:hypothetical protein HDU98_003894 [Podochytrium sp. JEL0797]
MAKESSKASKTTKPAASSKEEVDDSDMDEVMDFEEEAAPQTKITSTFKPPSGFEQLEVAESVFSKTKVDKTGSNTEIIVMRIPIDFPLESLNGIEIALDTKSKTSEALTTIKVDRAVKSKKSDSMRTKKVEYGVFDLGGSTGILGAGGVGGEIGEMDEFLPLFADAQTGSYRIASKKFTRHLSIAPLNSSIPSLKEFSAAANTLTDIAYVARVHPDGMKPQYEPYGSATDGNPLQESMKRYGSAESTESKKTATKRKHEESPAVAKKVSKKSSKKEK